MTFGIAAKLSGLLALVSCLIAGLTGLYAYQASRDLLVSATQDELMTATQVIARRIADMRLDLSRDLTLLARHPASLALLQTPPAAQGPQADQLNTLFQLLMRANPGYFQVRLISAADGGLERVRVDRDGAQLLRIEEDDLQEKNHYPYVSDTLQLPAGSTYLSRIVINHERGAHAGAEQPTAQFASPVVDAQGQALGVVVINLDFNGIFAKLAADLPKEFQLFLANQQGDFLIHPDRSKAFGFDRGQRVLLQEEFPATRELVTGQQHQVVLEAADGRYLDAPVVATFVATTVQVPSDESRLILGLAQPRSSVLARADQLGRTILQIAVGFGLAGFLLALLLARRITQPLNTMSEAVQHFAADRPITGLPLHRADELGLLARSFQHMQNQIQRQFAQLQAHREELEHLARHDVLTGLPNRRLFMERLENAVERAKRSDTMLAVMFIDMDHFKQINDQLGHDAGDMALQWVAQKLLANTRKTDTVGRLGGDEFVVLLDGPIHRDQVAAIAGKLRDSLLQPWCYGAHQRAIELSMGISLFPQDGESAEQLMSGADAAMYRIKMHSRNNFGFVCEPASPPTLGAP